MGGVLLDTHAWAWSLTADPRLSSPARAAIAQADAVLVSPISMFEIAQKVRIGKWPELAAYADKLPELLQKQGGFAAPLSADLCVQAGLLAWDHRDPFDRIIGVTAQSL
ncbi:MAG: type II toxin-antitoxin system VapC family toxin, partial [Leptolyngbyaceae cyanobacterium SL_7_1]|nr:type II toxin-antitoxin system VapC family toxin [Leptolyngbyaceae cyanobacterium SL_7_1]